MRLFVALKLGVDRRPCGKDLLAAPGLLDDGLLGVPRGAGHGQTAAYEGHLLKNDHALAGLGQLPGAHEAGHARTHDHGVYRALVYGGHGLGGLVAREGVGVAAGVHDGLAHGVHDGAAGEGGTRHGVNVEVLRLHDGGGHALDGGFADNVGLAVVEHGHLGDGAVGDDGLYVDGAVHAHGAGEVDAVGQPAGCGGLGLGGLGCGFGRVGGGGHCPQGGSADEASGCPGDKVLAADCFHDAPLVYLEG